VFHKTIPELQDHDQDKDRFFWSQTGLILRPTVSNHITGLVNELIMSGLARVCLHYVTRLYRDYGET